MRSHHDNLLGAPVAGGSRVSGVLTTLPHAPAPPVHAAKDATGVSLDRVVFDLVMRRICDVRVSGPRGGARW
jgi:hypothetical protein